MSIVNPPPAPAFRAEAERIVAHYYPNIIRDDYRFVSLRDHLAYMLATNARLVAVYGRDEVEQHRKLASAAATPLDQLSFAELRCAWTEAKHERDTAESIMLACGDNEDEEARFCDADERLDDIREHLRARLQSHVGAVALDQILEMV